VPVAALCAATLLGHGIRISLRVLLQQRLLSNREMHLLGLSLCLGLKGRDLRFNGLLFRGELPKLALMILSAQCGGGVLKRLLGQSRASRQHPVAAEIDID